MVIAQEIQEYKRTRVIEMLMFIKFSESDDLQWESWSTNGDMIDSLASVKARGGDTGLKNSQVKPL